MHLLIFSTVLTPRIKYIFNFIFRDILKAEVEFTGNSQYFLESKLPKLSYGEKPLQDELFFKSSALLYSSKSEPFNPKNISFDDYKVPFPVDNSAMPFDVFAASFFIVTRYEEYIHQQQSEDDFKASNSLQRKWKVLKRPIIDEWALIIKSLIMKKYPGFKFVEKRFAQHPMVHFNLSPSLPNGLWNQTQFVFSALFKKENTFFRSRYDELTGVNVKTELLIEELTTRFENKISKPLFFIHFPQLKAEYLTVNGISKKLNGSQAGLLRPCADSKEKITAIKYGRALLKKILPAQVVPISLQLEAIKFPVCYLNILNMGIHADYSMGYENESGFRAGTCTPFNWYDLQLEKVTPLVVHSYAINDRLLQYSTAKEGITELTGFINAVKMVNGTFHSCWNLKNLSSNPKYKKMKSLFNLALSESGD